MNEFDQMATAMLAIAFSALMLVASDLFVENRSVRLPAVPTAPMLLPLGLGTQPREKPAGLDRRVAPFMRSAARSIAPAQGQ